MNNSSVLVKRELHLKMKHVALERNVTVRSLYEEVVLQFFSSLKKESINKEAV